ncbi:MAG TPA: glycosyltransferase [bacterium]|nr:glycosyltransferase [bacterium]
MSAIITTFNRAGYLRAAIQSVLAQSFEELELLVLDNSSADDTHAVVTRFPDPRLRLIVHPRLGISAARNLGLREARGEFVAFLDDDDEWLQAKLDHQLRVFERGPATLALVYGGFVRITPEGRESGAHRPVLRGRVFDDLLRQRDAFTGSASNPLMRTSAVRELGGFNEDLATSEDWELYLRLAEHFEVDFVPEIVVRIRTHRGVRLGDRIDEARRVEELVLARYGQRMRRGLRGFYLRKIGGKLCRTGAMRQGRARILEAIGLAPLHPLAYVQYGISLLGGRAYERIHRRCRRWVSG